jgi:predicted aminopeptidase
MSVSAPARLLLLLAPLLLGGCATLGYYAHVSAGQLRLMSEREPVEDVLASLEGRTDEEAVRLAERLELSRQVLAFAEQTLGLESGGRYESFVELDREAVVWNLFAAPELSLTPFTWCYPFVGCAPYRGYFNRNRAEQDRARLAGDGYETYVGGVLAYSTLGWFDDPILSTFLDLSEGDFVELLLHELAHSRVWVKGDAGFNESFASFVGRQGAREWFRSQQRLKDFEAYLVEEAAWTRAQTVLEETRAALTDVFEAEASDERKRAEKARVLTAAGACLEDLATVTGIEGYRQLVPRLNNAYLASLATYSDQVPAFATLFSEADDNWSEFFQRVDDLGRLDDSIRQARMGELVRSAEDQVATQGDGDRADEVQCEALAGHGFDAELAR